jgi:DNA polymerase-3 subunit alpha
MANILKKKPLEELGLMKFDILGLANLTIIKNTLIAIEKYEGKHIDIWKIPEDDKATFDLLKRGDTTAVFQLESDGMKKYLRDLQPESLEDICFMCAAYRPGPMQFIPDYIECKHGRKEPVYLIPELEPIVKNTYGFAIYQEQVIRIVVDIAGYTMGEADILRRAMGKKIKEIMLAEKPKFIEGCVKRGHSNEVAEKLFEYLMPFADYGFNKAHAAGYAMIAYQTAYLKAHYPIEFTIGLLESDLETADKLHRDVEEARNLGIEVLQPDVNKSKLMFGIEEKDGKKCIRFGMGGIKTINRKVVEKIITERDKNGVYKHFDDLVGRVGITDLTKKTLEVLIETGALDAFGSRTQLLTIMPTVWNKYTRLKDERNQESLFTDSKVMGESATLLPNIEKETDKQKLVWERELLGTFFSNHPLRNYTYLIDNEKILSINKALEGEVNKPVLLLVILKETKKIISKKNGKPMAFLKLEDLETVLDSVLFNTSYEKYKDILKDGEIYLISGKINERNDQKSLLIDSIEPINDHTEVLTKIATSPVMKLENEPIKKKKHVSILIDVSLTDDKELLKRLKESIKNNPGDKEVVLRFKDSNETIVEKTLSTKIKLTKEMIAEYGELIH